MPKNKLSKLLEIRAAIPYPGSKDTTTAIYKTSMCIVELAGHFLDKRKYDNIAPGSSALTLLKNIQ